jgi:hypothetical protein
MHPLSKQSRVVIAIGMLSMLVACDAETATPLDEGPATLSLAQGLKGSYFQGTNFDSLVGTRTDAQVDFVWSGSAPITGLGTTVYSVRWTGQILAPASGTYTFATTSDDGVRLWVNGQALVDNWTGHAPTTNSGTITLTGAERYDIKLEYFQNKGGATISLAWTRPGATSEVIPSPDLFPTAGTLLGAAVSSGSTIGFDRNCAQFHSSPSQPMDCEQAAIGPDFHFGAHRVYNQWSNDVPVDVFNNDLANDRLTIWDLHVDCRSSGDNITWAQIANAQPGSAIHTLLKNKGTALAQWQATAQSSNSKWRGEQYFTFMHEADFGAYAFDCGPNTATRAAEWKAAYQNIVSIWKSAGVSMDLLHLGVILIGNHVDQWEEYWPPHDTWLNNNLTWAGADPYNWYANVTSTTSVCGQNKPWKSFADASSGFRTWVEAPSTYGHSALQPIIAETGDEEGPPGDPSKSKPVWFADMATFIKQSWPDLFALTYFDVDGLGGGPCRNNVDTTQASWDAWVKVAKDPFFR